MINSVFYVQRASESFEDDTITPANRTRGLQFQEYCLTMLCMSFPAKIRKFSGFRDRINMYHSPNKYCVSGHIEACMCIAKIRHVKHDSETLTLLSLSISRDKIPIT